MALNGRDNMVRPLLLLSLLFNIILGGLIYVYNIGNRIVCFLFLGLISRLIQLMELSYNNR